MSNIQLLKSVIGINHADFILSNGIKIGVSFNNCYVHLNFSGVELPMLCTSSEPDLDKNTYIANNTLNIYYDPRT